MKKVLTLLAMTALISSCGNTQQESADLASNPFMHTSTLELGAPNFSQIQYRHYLPAFEEGIRQQREEIEAICNNSQAPTFENTILAYEHSGEILNRTSNIFFALSSAEHTDSIQQIEEKVIPMLTNWSNEIMLNEKLFERIKLVYDNEYDKLQGEEKKLLHETYNGFVRNGANLTPEQKNEIKEINNRIAVLQQQYSTQLTDATNNAGIWVENAEELAGLSESQIKQLSADAQSHGNKAPYYIVITNTTQQPILASLQNRALREKVFNASIHRSDETAEHNLFPLVTELANLRARKANLLGYPNYAAYSLSDAMAQTPEKVYAFLQNLIQQYRPIADAETQEIERFAQKTMGTDFRLQPYDRFFYSAQMKRAQYNMSDDEVKPYFVLDSVLHNGVFYAANKVYGLSFEKRLDLPTYHPDMEVYTVKDKDGSTVGIFYTDFFRRPTKRGGAWMSAFQKQSYDLNQKPIIYNVCNFAKPSDGEPCLLTWDETTTLFHEFGHALHGFLSACKYRTLSGTAVARDFVELPSQFNEYWAAVPAIFEHYAKHYQTGEPMPQALKEKMLRSINFQPAYALGENLASTSLDLAWHMLPKDRVIAPEEAESFESEALQKMNLADAQIPPRYKSSYFRHIWEGGYSAGYYSYLWSEVLSANVGDFFTRHGGINPEIGQQYRDKILSKGNTLPFEQIFTDFTGLETPDASSLLKARGLK